MMSVPGPFSLAADLLDPLVPPPAPPGQRAPVVVPSDDARLAAVAAILRDIGALPRFAAERGIPVGVLERLAERHEYGPEGLG
jgi:hypothetical protein